MLTPFVLFEHQNPGLQILPENHFIEESTTDSQDLVPVLLLSFTISPRSNFLNTSEARGGVSIMESNSHF